MNLSASQIPSHQPEPGDLLARMWAARFAGKVKDSSSPRRWDPYSADDAEPVEVSGPGPLAMFTADGNVAYPLVELAGRRAFDHHGRGRRAYEPVRVVVDSARPAMTFAPYLLA